MIITAKERELGTKASRRLRRQGKVPGVIYGASTDNKHIELDKSELLAAMRKSRRNDKFEIEIEGKDKHEVIVKEIQWHPVTEEIRHIDFYKLTEGRPVTLFVPVVIKGEAKGVKLGGDLYQPRKKIMIEALPEAIPNEIVIDVTDLNIGDVVHVFDLDIPEGVKVKSTKNFTVVAILGRTKEEEETEEEETEEMEETQE